MWYVECRILLARLIGVAKDILHSTFLFDNKLHLLEDVQKVR